MKLVQIAIYLFLFFCTVGQLSLVHVVFVTFSQEHIRSMLARRWGHVSAGNGWLFIWLLLTIYYIVNSNQMTPPTLKNQ